MNGFFKATLVVGLMLLNLQSVSTQQIEVTHEARSLHPGEVVVLEVRATETLAAVQAEAFDSDISFFLDESLGLWRGLIGVDLETPPGNYRISLSATTGNGETRQATHALRVAAKEFPTRHLNVEPSFVNPPEGVIDRIQRESVRQAEIFRTNSSERQWEGGFVRPVSGEATSSFGRRSVYNGQPRSPHSGTDFRSGEGTPIAAPNGGTVVLAENLYFSGNVVIIDHGWGLYSYLAHLSTIDVIEGAPVKAGQVVGKVGSTGRVTGPHLHWTVRLNEARVDPLSLLSLFPERKDK